MDKLISQTLALAIPPEDLKLSEWCDKYAFLSPEVSAQPGKFTPLPYQREILDAMTDPDIERVIFFKSARTGFTACMDQAIAYYTVHDPSPCMIVLPRIEDSASFAKKEITPLFRDNKALAALAASSPGRQKSTDRLFSNGASLVFCGANSQAGFRRLTVRAVFCDEVDGYDPAGAGRDGDAVSLATIRTQTFGSAKKIICGSTPATKGFSRIESLYAESDMRRYHIPCPHCHEFQTLKWENLRWDKDQETGQYKPETAHFICEKCGGLIPESVKKSIIEAGKWIAEKPLVKTAGFALWAAYSPFISWREIVEGFLLAKGNIQELKVWVNAIKGESFEELSSSIEPATLQNRAENYNMDSIPEGVKYLVAGCDTQDDRLEMLVLGFGANEEIWIVDYQVFHGSPSQKPVWIDLDNGLR